MGCFLAQQTAMLHRLFAISRGTCELSGLVGRDVSTSLCEPTLFCGVVFILGPVGLLLD